MHVTVIVLTIIMLAALGVIAFIGMRVAGQQASTGESKMFLEECLRWYTRRCETQGLAEIDAELIRTEKTMLCDYQSSSKICSSGTMCANLFPQISGSSITNFERCQDVCANKCNPLVGPDLSVTDMDISFQVTATKKQDEKDIPTEWKAYIKIWNIGSATAENIAYEVWKGADIVKSGSITKLRPCTVGGVCSNEIYVEHLDSREIMVHVDPENKIKEINEYNNVARPRIVSE